MQSRSPSDRFDRGWTANVEDSDTKGPYDEGRRPPKGASCVERQVRAALGGWTRAIARDNDELVYYASCREYAVPINVASSIQTAFRTKTEMKTFYIVQLFHCDIPVLAPSLLPRIVMVPIKTSWTNR